MLMVPFFKFGIQNTPLRILFQAIDISRFLKKVDERPSFEQNCKLDRMAIYYYVVLEEEIFSFNLNDRLNKAINGYSKLHYS